MIKRLLLGIICLIFYCSGSLMGQNAQVKASLDSTYMLIGSQTLLKLEVTKSNNAKVRFPIILDTITRNVEVVNDLGIDSMETEGGLVRMTRHLTITSFDSGYHLIPPFLFFVTNSSGSIDTLTTNTLGLEIGLVPVDTTQAIKPIKGPENIPLTFWDALPWILGVLLAVAIGLGIWLYLRNRKDKEQPAKRIIPKEAAHIIALRALDELKGEKLWQQDQVKAYHSKLTDIVREYIENRFHITALEQTSDEILDAFSNRGLSVQVPIETLQQLLYLADMVKFAKGKPGPEENNRSMEQAYAFVNETIKKEIPTETEEDKEL